MYQTGGTIKETLEAIGKNSYVLPAIQREFVWTPEQISRLFDSLMQGFPFGTFLYWKVDKQNSARYKFYGFVRQYHERDNPHCPQLPTLHDREVTAVLDGQQRLTALNIGLCGSMAWRLPYRRKGNPNAYPQQCLYLDLLANPQGEGEDGETYRFRFLTAEEADASDASVCWFRVRDILGMQSGPAMLAWLNERLPQDKTTRAFETLDSLYQVVHNKNVIAFYEEKSQDLEKVLNIFIRMNSGGTVLSYSDLLLSIAVAQWSGDARAEIHGLVDQLNETGAGFGFSQDLALKAGLMIAEIGNVGFKVDNFNRDNMEVLERRWPEVKTALTVAVQLVASFGFSEKTLRADSAVLPIAYYISRHKLNATFLTRSSCASDRAEIRMWLTRSLLKSSGIWGSGLDTLLTALREAIRDAKGTGFPADAIGHVMNRRGKTLAFTNEEIAELVEMEYGDRRLFAMLGMLFPFVDVRNHFHIDHVFPRALFTKARLRKAGVPDADVDDFQQMVNSLPNLQLLEGSENIQKQAQPPAEWMKKTFRDGPSRTNYCDNHLLGDVPTALADFRQFYDKRREALQSRLAKLVGHSV